MNSRDLCSFLMRMKFPNRGSCINPGVRHMNINFLGPEPERGYRCRRDVWEGKFQGKIRGRDWMDELGRWNE